MNKKQLFLWSLYDFANSIVFINFLLYFGQWLVIDGGLSDFWYNATFAIATVLLIFTAPSLAALTDKYGGRKYFLNISTIGTFICYGLAALLAHNTSPNVLLITLLFLLGQYFYQLSFVFYQPMLADIADPEHRGRASGIGQFANELGQIAGLLMTLPLSGVRLAPLLPSVGVFFILALPMMIYFKESKIRVRSVTYENVKIETKAYSKKFISFFSTSLAAPMLVSFFFFNDALVTLSNNYPIYMERVFAIPDSTKSMLLLGVLVTAAIGSFISGWLSDKIGCYKLLKIILLGWIVLVPAVALSPNLPVFMITTGLVGFFLGSIISVTRAYLSNLLPKEEMGYGFSFYTLAERFATFLGPLTWGGLIWVLGTEGRSYRITMIIMTIYIIIGLIILSKWKRSQDRNEYR